MLSENWFFFFLLPSFLPPEHTYWWKATLRKGQVVCIYKQVQAGLGDIMPSSHTAVMGGEKNAQQQQWRCSVSRQWHTLTLHRVEKSTFLLYTARFPVWESVFPSNWTSHVDSAQTRNCKCGDMHVPAELTARGQPRSVCKKEAQWGGAVLKDAHRERVVNF